MYKDSKRMITRGSFFLLAILVFVIVISYMQEKAQAASSISVSEINYEDSTITLKADDSDSEIYFSDSKKKDWQTIPGDLSSKNTITMDISWVSISKNYVMTFKGNKSTSVVSVTIPKQITNFKATYNKVKGTVSFGNVGKRIIQWRKKGSTTWNTVNTATISTELGYLCTNGATVYFRLAPINGTSTSNVGMRASKEVTVTIPKKASAPAITIDGSKFSIAVKKGMAYRTVNSDGSTTDWTNISSSNDLLLKNIASSAMYTNSSTKQYAVTLQFRTNATSASQVSRISTATVPIQEGPPNDSTYGISLSYTSSSSVSLQVKAASSKVPFEYTIIDADEELNYQTASWTEISSGTAISLDEDTATKGSHIYVRKKSVNKTGDDDFALASVEINVTGTNGIAYPDAPTASTLTTLISTAGVCQTTNTSSYLTFKLYSATSTTVSSIDFLDTYGIDKGTVTCKSTVAKNLNSTGADDKYIITTKITSTSELDTVTNVLLYAKITLANSDVITSSDKAGVLLYLYPASTLNNPASGDDYKHYSNNFKRIYMSNDSGDDSYFKFKLDLGTINVPDLAKVNSFTSTTVAISTLKYEGYSLTKDTDYSVEYGSYVNDDNETIATATVTVYVSKFEKSALIDTTNIAEPLKITLNNGENLTSTVNITLVNTATLDDTPIAWSITEGKLEETKTTKVTNSDNTTSTVTEERIDYTLTLTLFDKSYGVGVSDVTWGGVSVLGTTKISGGTATIYLSNAKLNKLTTNSTDTKNLIITLSNGFTISTGCKLTVLAAK